MYECIIVGRGPGGLRGRPAVEAPQGGPGRPLGATRNNINNINDIDSNDSNSNNSNTSNDTICYAIIDANIAYTILYYVIYYATLCYAILY